MNAYSVAVVFWIFVTIAAVAGIVADYKKRKLALEPLRAAIERGQSLDPQIIDRLMRADREDHRVDPRDVQIGGVITCASGVGIALAAFFFSQMMPRALFPILAVAVLALCVGVGLIVAARILEKARLERVREDVQRGSST